jgi:chitinase
MSYDYFGPSDPLSGHHTGLYTSSQDTSKSSTDASVKAYLAAGVPAQKIVVGIAFYGKGWEMESGDNKGLFRKPKNFVRAGGYTFLKDSMINQNGYTRYWDEEVNAPYLFHAEKNIFITYDDEQSVKAKCDYIKKNNLGGAMFWEYNSDKKEYLLKTIAKI